MVSATTLGLPSTPANVAATAASSSQIKVTWSASSGTGGIAAYYVFSGASPGGLTKVATTTNLSYTAGSLTPSSTYYFALQAIDKLGETSPLSPAVPAVTFRLPTTPASLSAAALSRTLIKLAWNASASPLGIAAYNIYCGASPAALGQTGITTNTSFYYSGLSAGATYSCAVQAIDTMGGLSALSNKVSATTPL